MSNTAELVTDKELLAHLNSTVLAPPPLESQSNSKYQTLGQTVPHPIQLLINSNSMQASSLTTHHQDHVDLFREYGDAFNIEGLSQTGITQEQRAIILEWAVARARWYVGRGRRKDECDQAILGVRDLIAQFATTSRYTVDKAWAMRVSGTFFLRICAKVTLAGEGQRALNSTVVSQQIHPNIGSLPEAQKVDVSPPISTRTRLGFSQQSVHRPVSDMESKVLENVSSNEVPEVISSRKRKKIDEDGSTPHRASKKGKGRATSDENASALPRHGLEMTTEANEDQPLSTEVGSENLDTISGGPQIPAEEEHNVESQEQIPNGIKTKSAQQRRQDRILDTFMKAHATVLTPSERARINLCIAQACRDDHTVRIPLIANPPKFQCYPDPNDRSFETGLVKDCLDAIRPPIRSKTAPAPPASAQAASTSGNRVPATNPNSFKRTAQGAQNALRVSNTTASKKQFPPRKGSNSNRILLPKTAASTITGSATSDPENNLQLPHDASHQEAVDGNVSMPHCVNVGELVPTLPCSSRTGTEPTTERTGSHAVQTLSGVRLSSRYEDTHQSEVYRAPIPTSTSSRSASPLYPALISPEVVIQITSTESDSLPSAASEEINRASDGSLDERRLFSLLEKPLSTGAQQVHFPGVIHQGLPTPRLSISTTERSLTATPSSRLPIPLIQSHVLQPSSYHQISSVGDTTPIYTNPQLTPTPITAPTFQAVPPQDETSGLSELLPDSFDDTWGQFFYLDSLSDDYSRNEEFENRNPPMEGASQGRL